MRSRRSALKLVCSARSGCSCDNEGMDEQTHERIRAAIARVPRGRVASYGDIAAMTDAPSPRIVGWVLKEDGGDLPWQRIVRTDGTVAKPQQLPMLRGEGLEISGDKIDMKRYRWDPDDGPDANAIG